MKPDQTTAIYYLGNHRQEILSGPLTMREAYKLANERGLVTFTLDDDGKPQLVGDDPVLEHKLGNRHCMTRLPKLARDVFSTVNERGGGFHKLPRNVRRTALAWCLLINQKHRRLYLDVISGSL